MKLSKTEEKIKKNSGKVKEEKGITLIALVITIIVLLILAGISIVILTGENGLFGRAKRAEEATKISQAEEDIKLKILEYQAENEGKNPTLNQLATYLKNAKEEYEVTLATKKVGTLKSEDILSQIVDSTEKIYVTKTEWGIEIEVTKDLKIEATGKVEGNSTGGSSSGSGTSSGSGDTGSVSDSRNVSITKNGQSVNIKVPNNIEAYYGRRVKYDAGSEQTDITEKTWRLFYVDFDGDYGEQGDIYLKADWTNNDMMTCSTTYDSTKTKVKELNPSWAEARGDRESDWKENEKVAAWLCDTSKWTNFASTAYEEGIVKYAIGTPPVEMFMKSYGDKTGQPGYKAKYFANGTDAYGYKYKTASTDNDSDYKYYTAYYTIRSRVANGMYIHHEFKDENNNLPRYILASPMEQGAFAVPLVRRKC